MTVRPNIRELVRVFALLVAVPAIGGCLEADQTHLDAVKRRGELVMLTAAGTTTYYEASRGPAGFEHDLARRFADQLGVRLRVVAADRFADILPRLTRGEADFAAGGIVVVAQRGTLVRLTPPYQQVRLQVVYRRGNERPARIEDLIGRDMEVETGTIYAERLRELKQSHPDLEWTETPHRRQDEHLQLVWQGLLDLTLTDSNTLAANRPHFPEILVGLSLPDVERLAWAFRRSDDESLYAQAVKFLEAQRRSGVIAQLADRYYGPGSRANFLDVAAFRACADTRLPVYRGLFERAGKKYDLDWRLVAAVGYQESYWNPQSVSPTGVRGFMMLTRATALELGVEDRLDPAASIDGGARYLRHLLGRLPERIRHPDRLWLALAAYNVGLYHVEDARILTQKQGGDPDRWNDVRKRLPLLADPKWYRRTRYGYARGHEPVRFVDRVRVYYRALVRIDSEENARRRIPALDLRARAI